MSLQPINFTAEIEQYINCGKIAQQLLTTESSITWNAAANTVRRLAVPANLGFPTAGQGTGYAEDSPTGLANENVIIMTGPAAGTAFNFNYVWRNFKKWLLDKCVINVGLALDATVNAGNDCNFDSVSIQLREVFPDGSFKPIIQPENSVATGHTTLTGAGTQSFIFEKPYIPNYTFQDNSWVILSISCGITVGTATLTNGILPAFPFQKTNATKWITQSGVYLLGRGIV